MVKFIFWALLCINALVFAYGQGYLGKFQGNEREPARLKSQVNTAKLTLMSASQGQAAAPAGPGAAPVESPPAEPAPAEPAPAPVPVAAAPVTASVACLEAGNFAQGDARRFERRLAALALGQRMSRVAVPGQEVSSYLVYIPPQPSKEAAERKAAELRGLDVTNFYIMNGESPLKWAISLGVFKTEAGAQTLLATLNRQGVQGARIAPRGTQGTRLVYQFRDIDAAMRDRIVRIASAFDEQQVRACQ